MPMTGRECDYCGNKNKTVYEKYKVTTGNTIQVKINALGHIEPAKMKYQCNPCYVKEKLNET